MTFKSALKMVLPPIALTAIRHIRSSFSTRNSLKYSSAGWKTARQAGSGQGYDASALVRSDAGAWEPLISEWRRKGRAGYDRNSLLGCPEDVPDRDLYLAFAYILALAAHEKKAVRILDYGGSFGYYYWVSRILGPAVEIEYHCKEMPNIAEEGRRLTPEIHWHTDDSCFNDRFDLIVFSGVLPYIEGWRTLLKQAAMSTERYLYVTFTPIVEVAPSFVSVHRWQGETILYETLNRMELIGALQASGFQPVHEFCFGRHPEIRNAPEQPLYRGWFCEKR